MNDDKKAKFLEKVKIWNAKKIRNKKNRISLLSRIFLSFGAYNLPPYYMVIVDRSGKLYGFIRDNFPTTFDIYILKGVEEDILDFLSASFFEDSEMKKAILLSGLQLELGFTILKKEDNEKMDKLVREMEDKGLFEMSFSIIQAKKEKYPMYMIEKYRCPECKFEDVLKRLGKR